MLLKMLKSMVRNTGAPRAAGGADYAWVGNDLADGIEAALADPAAVTQRIAAGQRYVDKRFATARVAALWARVLEG